jgi:hypothetical protein
MSIIPSFGQSSHDDSPTFSMDDFEGNLLNCWLENMQTILWVMKRVMSIFMIGISWNFNVHLHDLPTN